MRTDFTARALAFSERTQCAAVSTALLLMRTPLQLPLAPPIVQAKNTAASPRPAGTAAAP